MKAYVYKNIRTGLYSIMVKGKVIHKVSHVHIINCEFKIRQSGYERCLREKKRNVHAFIVGEFEINNFFVSYGAKKARYNPYKYNFFFDEKTEKKIISAEDVWLTPEGIWVDKGTYE